jgi:hypothetical protein
VVRDEVAARVEAVVRERPILFSAPMVRAILDGRKTQTRRLVSTREPLRFLGGRGDEADPARWGWFFDGPDHHGYMVLGRGLDERHDHGCVSIPCPYGSPGDRLWVRETWGLHSHGDETDWFRGSVRGVSEESLRAQYHLALRADWGPLQDGCYWRPGIFMPRWASRITLEITEVRVQRLQEISEDDARAEGTTPGELGGHYAAFSCLWDRINLKRAPWSSNPWVWAVTFRTITAP